MISIDEEGHISIDGQRVPYKQLPRFFSLYGYLSDTGEYVLSIDGAIYSYVDKNNVLVFRRKIGNLSNFHCSCGPAVVEKNLKREYYFLDGVLQDQHLEYKFKQDKIVDIENRKIVYSDKFSFVLCPKGEKKRHKIGTYIYGMMCKEIEGYDVVHVSSVDSKDNATIEKIEQLAYNMDQLYDDSWAYNQGLVYFNDSFSVDLKSNLTSFTITGKDNWTGKYEEYEIGLMNKTNKSIKNTPPSFLDSFDEKASREAKMKKIQKALDLIYDRFPSLSYNSPQSTIYGVSVPTNVLSKARYNPTNSNYYWINGNGNLESHEGCPSLITPEGNVFFHKNGELHNEDGPAFVSLKKINDSKFFIYDRALTDEEFVRYNKENKSVEFRDEYKYLHRDNGPAVIKFFDDGRVFEEFYRHGVNTFNIDIKKGNYFSPTEQLMSSKEKVREMRKINVTATKKSMKEEPMPPPSQFYEITQKEIESLRNVLKNNMQYIRAYRNDILEASNEIKLRRGLPLKKATLDKKEAPAPSKYKYTGGSEVKLSATDIKLVEESIKEALGVSYYMDDQMTDSNKALAKEEATEEIEVKKRIRSAPDLTGSKISQVTNGFKFGFKKQVINNSSRFLANKVVALSPVKDNIMAERFAQLCFLLGGAEIVSRLPESVAEKVRFSEDARLNFASSCRYVSGEVIGRDIVELFAYVLPTVIEMFKDMTTEEIKEQADEFEESLEEEQEIKTLEENTSTEELFKVQQQEYAEVVSR